MSHVQNVTRHQLIPHLIQRMAGRGEILVVGSLVLDPVLDPILKHVNAIHEQNEFVHVISKCIACSNKPCKQ